MQPDNSQDSYFAGILDGEGTVRVETNVKGIPRLVVYVSNTSRDLVEYLHDTFGGNIHLAKEQTTKHKACWRWVISGLASQACLKAAQPYCIVKKRHVLLGLAFLDTVVGRGIPVPEEAKLKRARIEVALKFLNRRGPRSSREDKENNG